MAGRPTTANELALIKSTDTAESDDNSGGDVENPSVPVFSNIDRLDETLWTNLHRQASATSIYVDQ